MQGRFPSVALPTGAIHHLVFLLSGSRLPPLPAAYALAHNALAFPGACGEGRGEDGFALTGVTLRTRRGAVGFAMARSILNLPYFGSEAVPTRCSNPESRSWGSSSNRVAVWT